jgi:hypothetical protein
MMMTKPLPDVRGVCLERGVIVDKFTPEAQRVVNAPNSIEVIPGVHYAKFTTMSLSVSLKKSGVSAVCMHVD